MNRLAKIKNYKGVTFMELMIVIAIVSIFASMSWANYNNAKQQAEVDGVCSDLAATINQTRSLALTGKKVDFGGTIGEIVPDFFLMSIGSSSYYLRAHKASYSTGYVTIGSTIYIKKGVILSFTDTDGNHQSSSYFRYAVPGGEKKESTTKTYNVNKIEVKKGNITKNVNISLYRAVCE